jgi:ketosteroid isomerase-like protein
VEHDLVREPTPILDRVEDALFGITLQGSRMSDISIRPIVEAFYRASAERDVARVATFIADDVDWLVQGPVDLFAFFGQRHGKAAVLEGYREIARKLEITAYKVETLLVDGDRAAALIRMTAVVLETGKVMSVRTSQFSRFRDGRMVEMRAVLDSYDMVEQVLGKPFDLAPHLAPEMAG